MRSTPILSIIIPTRNNVPQLSNALVSIRRETSESLLKDTEIIVVVNGNPEDKDDTLSFIDNARQSLGLNITGMRINTAGFSAAINAGLKRSRGEYICLLNDDVVVTGGWMELMLTNLEKANEEHPDVKFGFTGPRSNNVIDSQMLPQDFRKQCPFITDPNRANEVSAIIRESSVAIPYSPLQFISGFCFVMTREVFENVGYFENFGLGGFEDNDYCLRAVEKGFIGCVANNVFVFHFGQQTLNRFASKSWWGDRGAFLKKWYKPSEKKLCVSYRVKIGTPSDMALLYKSVEASLLVADYVVIFDDKSPSVISFNDPRVTVYRKYEDILTEAEDREKLHELAQATGADWILNLDHDEVIDPSITKEDFQKLMNPIDPQCKYYVYDMAHFWRGETHCRVDGVWGNLGAAYLYKNEKAWGGIKNRGSNLHCRRIPALLPPDAGRKTFQLIIKHYGYADYERQVLPKYDYYNAIDKTEEGKEDLLIGSKGYSHFIDESAMSLVRYKKNKIDLIYLVKNDFDDLVNRIHEYGRMFSSFIVVDTGCNQPLKEWCDYFGLEYHEFKCCDRFKEPDHLLCDIAAARNFGIDQCKGDYIAFMDPDEQFQLPTIYKLHQILMTEPDIVMCDISNLNTGKNGEMTAFMTHQPRIFRNTPKLRYNDPIHETLERSVKAFIGIKAIKPGIMINHYGFLKTNKEQRKAKNDRYAIRLEEFLKDNPDHARALFSLGIDRNENGRHAEGDVMIERAVALDPAFWTARWELARRNFLKGMKVIMECPPELRPPDERWTMAANVVNNLLQYIPVDEG